MRPAVGERTCCAPSISDLLSVLVALIVVAVDSRCLFSVLVFMSPVSVCVSESSSSSSSSPVSVSELG